MLSAPNVVAQDFCVGDLDHDGTVGVDDTILFLEDLPGNDYSVPPKYPCPPDGPAPVLGIILTYVGTKQNVLFGIIMLFAFAFGLGFLLILIGTFTGILTSLPKSGPWMVKIKQVFGILMILVGEYFLIKTGQLMI